MKTRYTFVTVVLWVAVLGLSACDAESNDVASRGDGSVSTITATAPTPASGDLLRGRVLPLFAYQETPEGSFATARASAILKNQCLARYGQPPLEVPAVSTATPSMYRVYGVTDPVIAAKYGYHIDPVGKANQPTEQQLLPTYSPDQQLVLLGYAPGHEVPDPDNLAGAPTPTYQGKAVPQLGCQGEASRKLSSPDLSVEDLTLAQRLGEEAFVRSTTDRRMTAATKRWATCMKSQGYGGNYTDPFGAWNKFRISKPLTSREIATAVADVECKGETKLIDTWFAVESEYEQKLIQDNFETLTRVKAARDAALATALEIAGNSTEPRLVHSTVKGEQ